MGALGIGDTETVSIFYQVAAYIFDNRVSHVRKINVYQIAYGAGHLIHQSGGLSEVDVLRILTNDGDINRGKLHLIVEAGYDGSDDGFESGRGGQACANQYVGWSHKPGSRRFCRHGF